jgi:serine/threonine protein kinase
MAGFPDVPGYRLSGELGRGGFATVFLAEQLSLGRNVALKVLRNVELTADDMETFRRECTSLMAIDRHPNIVQIFDAGTTSDERPYIAMEYLAGGSLRSITKARKLSIDEVAQVGAEIADALTAVHSAGILHRDVKPANILVGSNGRYLLGDFGVASAFRSTRSSAVGLAGTPDFMAPEVVNGKRATSQSDIYSLGATLYQLSSGTSPFGRDTDESIATTLLRIVQEQPTDIRSFDTPEWLATTIEAAMSKDPANRFASAAEMASVLRSRSVPVLSASNSPWVADADDTTIRRAEATVIRPRPTQTELPSHADVEASPKPGRKRTVLVGVGVAAALLAGGVAFASTRGKGKPTSSVLGVEVTNSKVGPTVTTLNASLVGPPSSIAGDSSTTTPTSASDQLTADNVQTQTVAAGSPTSNGPNAGKVPPGGSGTTTTSITVSLPSTGNVSTTGNIPTSGNTPPTTAPTAKVSTTNVPPAKVAPVVGSITVTPTGGDNYRFTASDADKCAASSWILTGPTPGSQGSSVPAGCFPSAHQIFNNQMGAPVLEPGDYTITLTLTRDGLTGTNSQRFTVKPAA